MKLHLDSPTAVSYKTPKQKIVNSLKKFTKFCLEEPTWLLCIISAILVVIITPFIIINGLYALHPFYCIIYFCSLVFLMASSPAIYDDYISPSIERVVDKLYKWANSGDKE